MLNVNLENGKYTVIQEDDGRLYALRYGEVWRDLCGDKLVYSLAAEVERLREKINPDKDQGILKLEDEKDKYIKIKNLLIGSEFEECVSLEKENTLALIFYIDECGPKEQWTEYIDVQERLGELGLALKDPVVEHDCISGELDLV